MDEKSSAAGQTGSANDRQAQDQDPAQGQSPEPGAYVVDDEGRKRKVQRRLKLEDLPRDEDGKVILPDDITYPEFIRLTHPEMTDAQVEKALRKEHRSVNLVRAEIAAFAVLIIVIIVLIVTS